MSMSIKRRDFMKTLGMGVGFGFVPMSVLHAAPQVGSLAEKEVWVSAASLNNRHGDIATQSGLAWFDTNPSVKASASMNLIADFRGHGICLNPSNSHQALMMARRPGMYGLIADVNTGQKIAEFSTQAPYEFQGHACYSADGKTIFTSEMINDITDSAHHGQGRIGIRDAQTYKRIGELNSYGIEPHEIRLMPDGRTLVIANGGLCPDDKIHKNLPAESMQSSLVFINSVTGELKERCVLDEEKASVRHISFTEDGSVVVALQVQRQVLNDSAVRPLAAIKRLGEPLKYLHAPDTIWLGAKDYMGSVAILELDASKTTISIAGMTSPRGNLAVFWDVTSGSFLGYHALHDVCGIAASPKNQSFVLTNSAGEMRFIDPISLQEHRHLRQKNYNVRWDNHLALAVI